MGYTLFVYPSNYIYRMQISAFYRPGKNLQPKPLPEMIGRMRLGYLVLWGLF